MIKKFAKNIIGYLGLKLIYGLRFAVDRLIPLVGPKKHSKLIIQDISVTQQLKLRVYKPQQSRLLPIIIFFHGGGWMIEVVPLVKTVFLKN